MKVYLQYPWKFPDSPYYKYLIDNPPEDIEYLNVEKQKGIIINKRFFWFSRNLKKGIRNIVGFLGLPIPNAHRIKTSEEYDLLHCAHCLSRSNKPWIADFEGVWQFSVSGNKTKIGTKMISRILKKDNCKKIIAWTKESKRDIIKQFPHIKNKVEVIYPAVPFPKIKKKPHEGINLLLVGRYFYEKGGLHALEVINRLTKKYDNVNAIIVSEIPNKVKEEYSKNKKIKFYGLMTQKELFDIYAKSDLFIYFGYSDSFGFLYLEVMSYGIPIITVEGFARKEIIEEGVTGFVIDKPAGINKFTGINNKVISPIEESIISQATKKAGELIENPSLRKRMSENCIAMVEHGKFSIEERNRRLKDIYNEVSKGGCKNEMQ